MRNGNTSGKQSRSRIARGRPEKASVKPDAEAAATAAEAGGQILYTHDLGADRILFQGNLRLLFAERGACLKPAPELLNRVHPGDRLRVGREFKRAQAKGGSYRLQYWAYRPDGRMVHLLDRGRFVRFRGSGSRRVGTIQEMLEFSLKDFLELLRDIRSQLEVSRLPASSMDRIDGTIRDFLRSRMPSASIHIARSQSVSNCETPRRDEEGRSR